MEYYIGYFNKTWDKSEFTVIAGAPGEYIAQYITDWFNREGEQNGVQVEYQCVRSDDDSIKEFII